MVILCKEQVKVNDHVECIGVQRDPLLRLRKTRIKFGGSQIGVEWNAFLRSCVHSGGAAIVGVHTKKAESTKEEAMHIIIFRKKCRR